MRFVLASHNKGKLAELQEILGELGVEVVLQSDVGLDLEPDETGTTFAENAKIKAQAVMEASGLPGHRRRLRSLAWTPSRAAPGCTAPATASRA